MEECDLVVDEPVFVGEVINNRAINLKNEDDPYPTTFFAMKIDWKDLVPTEEDDGQHFYLKESKKRNADVEKLSTLKFINVDNAKNCCLDALAIAAFAKTETAFKAGRI